MATDCAQVTRTGPAHWAPGLPIAPSVNPLLRNSRYIATSTHTTIEWAAQHGYALLLPYNLGIDKKAELVTLYEYFADQHGADPTTVSHVATAVAQVADTRTEAVAAIRESGGRWCEGGLTNLGHDTLRSMPAYRAKLDEEQCRNKSPAHLIDGLSNAGPVGTVNDCVAWLDELVIRTGVKRTALFLDVSGNHQSTTENMTRFAEEVLPQLSA
ncbi:MAG: LLM class flavin-dependent oxidoreductase [Pseudonocardiaceae bacterium]